MSQIEDFYEKEELFVRYDWLLHKPNMYALYDKDLYNILVKKVDVQPSDSICHWNTLPREVMELIIKKVNDPRSLCRLSCVNKQLFQ